MATNKHGWKISGAIGFLAAGIFISLLAGCATDGEDIKFAGEKNLPPLATNSPATVLLKNNSLPVAEEQKIQAAVFSSLLTRHFWDDAGFTAVFLQADDEVVAALQKKFSDRQPPIKETSRISLLPGFPPRDKDTALAAIILSADVNDPEPDGSVNVVGKWDAGGAVTGFYSYRLLKTGDDWTILDAP